MNKLIITQKNINLSSLFWFDPGFVFFFLFVSWEYHTLIEDTQKNIRILSLFWFDLGFLFVCFLFVSWEYHTLIEEERSPLHPLAQHISKV